jgi:hypothetical protein
MGEDQEATELVPLIPYIMAGVDTQNRSLRVIFSLKDAGTLLAVSRTAFFRDSD